MARGVRRWSSRFARIYTVRESVVLVVVASLAYWCYAQAKALVEVAEPPEVEELSIAGDREARSSSAVRTEPYDIHARGRDRGYVGRGRLGWVKTSSVRRSNLLL
jgi:hypothetical protein